MKKTLITVALLFFGLNFAVATAEAVDKQPEPRGWEYQREQVPESGNKARTGSLKDRLKSKFYQSEYKCIGNTLVGSEKYFMFGYVVKETKINSACAEGSYCITPLPDKPTPSGHAECVKMDKVFEDYKECSGPTAKKLKVGSEGVIYYLEEPCPKDTKCLSGECVVTKDFVCDDDDGSDYQQLLQGMQDESVSQAGSVKYGKAGEVLKTYYDTCKNKVFLNEYACDGANLVTVGINCQNKADVKCVDDKGVGYCNDDKDNDGTPNQLDNCVDIANSGQKDSDLDKKGDACDNCPLIQNSDQKDSDEDSDGDVCDNCPAFYNPDQTNSDGKGKGDACQPDGISCGEFNCCVVTVGGNVSCWGSGFDTSENPSDVYNDYKGKVVTGVKDVVKLSVDHGHACVLTKDYNVYCWGENDLYQLGFAGTDFSSVPVKVSALEENAIFVNTNNSSSYAIDKENRIWSWGGGGDNLPEVLNVFGDDNIGLAYNYPLCTITKENNVKCAKLSDTEAKIIPDFKAKEIKSSGQLTCARTLEDKLACWGEIWDALIKDDNSIEFVDIFKSAVPTTIFGFDSTIKGFAVDSDAVCVITPADDLKCSGLNLSGKFGIGGVGLFGEGDEWNTEFVTVHNNVDEASIANFYLCILTNEGKIRCAGSNSNFQLGVPRDSNVPLLYPDTQFKQESIEGGFFGYSGIMKGSKSAYRKYLGYTGYEIYKGLGDNIKSLAVDNHSGCAITATSDVRCWGQPSNYIGEPKDVGITGFSDLPIKEPLKLSQNGILMLGSENSPQKLAIITDWAACALVKDGKVMCWGKGKFLGNGGSLDSSLPVYVVDGQTSGPISGAKNLYESGRSFCAILADDSVKCWGEAVNCMNIMKPECAANVALVPYWNADGSKIKSVFSYIITGRCVIKVDGSLNCHGGSWVMDVNSLDFPENYKFKKVVTSESHACALTEAGDVFCWGINQLGQVGDGTLLNADKPIKVNIPTPEKIVDIALNSFPLSSCAITESGVLYCWGVSAKTPWSLTFVDAELD